MNRDTQKHRGFKRLEKKKNMSAFYWLVYVTLIAAIVTNTQPASAFSTSIHERITRNAFPFLTDDVLDTIVDGNEDEDQGDEADLAERHAQNCQFRESAAYYNMRYRQIVDALREPQASDPDRAARLFGHLLHGIQDFYSHSNWIPTPPEGLGIRGRLFDSGLGFWPLPRPYSILFDDVVIIEGNPPKDVSVRLPVDANGRVSSAVPIVLDWRVFDTIDDPILQQWWSSNRPRTPALSIDDQPQFRGLMTSGAPREEVNGFYVDQLCPPVGSDCKSDSPDDVCLRHGEWDIVSVILRLRNFDGAGRMNLDGEGDGDRFYARHYARLQTQHEWCRLLHLSRELDPTFVASGRLLGTWIETDTGANTPHIPGTPCERGAARHHLVEISATSGMNAPLTTPFVVFRSDFTSSARATVTRQVTKTLRICGNSNEMIVASLMPARIKGGTLVIHVPGTAQSWTAQDNRGEFSVSFAIKVTPNVC